MRIGAAAWRWRKVMLYMTQFRTPRVGKAPEDVARATFGWISPKKKTRFFLRPGATKNHPGGKKNGSPI